MKISVAEISVEFIPDEFRDDRIVGLEGCGLCSESISLHAKHLHR